jgi:transcriptional regulator with XRE-family HTH domain
MEQRIIEKIPGMGARIRIYREKHGYTQESFSEAVDLTPAYIGQLERGQKTPSLSIVAVIAEKLNVSIDFLVYGDSILSSENIYDLKINVKDKRHEEIARELIKTAGKVVSLYENEKYTAKKKKPALLIAESKRKK